MANEQTDAQIILDSLETVDDTINRIKKTLRELSQLKEAGADVGKTITDLDRLLSKLMAEKSSGFLSEWTSTVTQQRKAAWETWISQHKGVKPRELAAMIQKQEATQGWTLNQLAAALKAHGGSGQAGGAMKA